MHIYGSFLLLDLIMHFRHTHTQTAQTQHSKAVTHKYAALQYPPPHPAAEAVIWYKAIGLDYFVANGKQVVMHLKPQPKS